MKSLNFFQCLFYSSICDRRPVLDAKELLRFRVVENYTTVGGSCKNIQFTVISMSDVADMEEKATVGRAPRKSCSFVSRNRLWSRMMPVIPDIGLLALQSGGWSVMLTLTCPFNSKKFFQIIVGLVHVSITHLAGHMSCKVVLTGIDSLQLLSLTRQML